MKFMIQWDIAPADHPQAGAAFLKSGAPMPEGLTLVGRWHAPGSGRGWALVETTDAAALAQHASEWAHLLDLDITPVVDDEGAAQALSRVYGS